MPVPSVVLHALNSLNIASLPSQIDAGEHVDLGLSPGLNVFEVLWNPTTLFNIQLNNITLDNVAIDLTNISLAPVGSPGQLQLTLDASNPSGSLPGAADLEVVSKAVEFNPQSLPTGTKADDIDTNEASLRALPYLIPNGSLPVAGTNVEGLLSAITGTVTQLERLTGGITGSIGGHIIGTISGTIQNLGGSVTAPTPLTSRPGLNVEWFIKDGNGKLLTQGTDFVMEGDDPLTGAASVKFMPEFAELSDKGQLFATRRVFCKVTVTVDGESTFRELGPVEILLVRIPFPTVLVMTEHAVPGDADPGDVLIAVPSESLVKQEQLLQRLTDLMGKLAHLQTLIETLDFTDLIAQIDRITRFTNPQTNRVLTFRKGNGVMDLWQIERDPPPFFIFGGTSWEDCISSLIMIGPPGRAARFYVAKNFWERRGAFEIILGAKAVAHIINLTGSDPACEPTHDPPELGDCIFNQRWVPPPDSFNDALSSFQFLPFL